MTSKCCVDKRQRRGVAHQEALDLHGVGRGEGSPCRLRRPILSFTDWDSHIGQRGQLVCFELSKTDITIQTGIVPDTNQTEFYATEIPAAKPIEHLDKDKL